MRRGAEVLQGRVSDVATTFFKEFREQVGGEPRTAAAGVNEEASNFEERTAVVLRDTAGANRAQALVGQHGGAAKTFENCSIRETTTGSLSSLTMCTWFM